MVDRPPSVAPAVSPQGGPPTPGGGHFLRARPGDIHRASPAHRYRHYIRAFSAAIGSAAGELELAPGDQLVDYGCANLPYRNLFPVTVDYLGADLPGNPKAAVEIDPAGQLPLDDGCCDALLSTQVLEHVGDPALYLSEAHRVLRSGGQMLLSTHGTFVYHPDPVDYWRWTLDGLLKLVVEAGFEVERTEGVFGLVPVGMQLIQDAVYHRLASLPQRILTAGWQTLIAAADRLHSPESKRMNASVYLVMARKP